MQIRKNYLPPLYADYIPPSDKSISHRGIFFSSISSNEVKISNFLLCDDCLRTIDAFRELGVEIRVLEEEAEVHVKGVGLRGLRRPQRHLYLGNSGTTARLLLGLLSAQNFDAVIEGDESLSRRPMRRVTEPLSLMGAKFEGRDGANYLPIKVKGGKLKGITYRSPIPSAQVKSAILIAGLYAEGKTELIEPAKSRDHTERMLKAFGANVEIDGLKVSVEPTEEINVCDFSVPGDISSASFFITLGVLAKDSALKIKDVGLNPTRLGFVSKLQEAGAKIELVQRVSEEESPIGEPSGDIIVRSSDLKAFVVEEEEIPSLIDELPLLFLIGCFAQGRSYIRGASELRVKETDRINSMFTNLRAMGAKIELDGDDVVIDGPIKLKGARLKSFLDHRTAMCAIIASLLAEGDSWIDDVNCVNISFPSFIDDLKGLIGDGVEFVK